MSGRDISTSEVEDILAKPDGTIRQSMDKLIAYKKLKGRKDNCVAIIAVEKNNEFEIITVMVNFGVRK
jgi:serine/threonine protein phosphatase PrpC